MHRARRTFIATSLVALLAIAGVTAAIAADPAPAPPPRIAFLANGIVPADALAAGPIAGQLGAPVFTTRQEALPTGTADALTAYNPELVVVMGGPVAISDAVVTQVSAATGLPAVDPTPTPATGVVRAAGGDRFETATIVADLLAAYAPAYLPVDLQAVDADLLDGMDSTDFLTDIHETSVPSNNSLTGATSLATAETVATMDLPAGTYVISGQIGANSSSTDRSRVVCRTVVDGSTRATSVSTIGGDPGFAFQASMAVAATATLAGPATLDVNCWAEGLTGDAPFIGASTSRIVATRMNG